MGEENFALFVWRLEALEEAMKNAATKEDVQQIVTSNARTRDFWSAIIAAVLAGGIVAVVNAVVQAATVHH